MAAVPDQLPVAFATPAALEGDEPRTLFAAWLQHYAARELDALEAWVEACKLAEERSKDAREHGPGAAYAVAMVHRDTLHDEAEVLGLVVEALENLKPR